MVVGWRRIEHFAALLCLLRCCAAVGGDEDVDPNGYIMFCPCMGRFGNQADHYLGALAFAVALNRTLVLPPLIEYSRGRPGSAQVPFAAYFDVEAVREYHRVIPMKEFFASPALGGRIWPRSRRVAFCYSKRQPSPGDDGDGGGGGACHAKSGNPFGPFWDRFGVDFVASETYGPNLHHDVRRSNNDVVAWRDRYPSDRWPVLAFTGAPASYPVQEENVGLHERLFRWNPAMESRARGFVEWSAAKFVGVHLRNGADWSRACDVIAESPSLFAAAQCVGYRNERGKATLEMCLPSAKEIARKVRRAIGSAEAEWVFVASDAHHMVDELSAVHGVKVVKLPEDDPHLDLAILGRADHFVGNCISSFSAFVKRERDARGLPTTFFGFHAATGRRRSQDDEL